MKEGKRPFLSRRHRSRAVPALLLSLVMILAFPVEVFAAQYLRTTINLRLRSAPSTSAAILRTIPSGTELEIQSTTGNWARTWYVSEGYAGLKYMTPTSRSEMTKVTTNLRLRSGPSTDYSIITTIPIHTPIPVLGTSGNWTKTLWNGTVGWVGTAYTVPLVDLTQRITTAGINFRSGPGTGYSIIGTVAKGTVIPALTSSGDWVKTWHNGRTGWVARSYTKTLSELPQRETTTDLNLRSGPGTSYPVLKVLPGGTLVPLLTESGNWIQTWHKGTLGWLSKTYLIVPDLNPRPASPPDSILSYSNTKYSWSHAYPEDSHYGYPELGGRYRYDTGKVHLTFDLGYENGLTPSILTTLRANNVKAIMYVTGSYIRAEPDLVRQMLADGHIVGNHSNSHPDTVDLMAKSMQLVYDDLRVWESEYKKITGSVPARWYYRAPSGIFSQRTIGLAYWMGYTTDFWQVALRDWDPDDQLTDKETMDRLMADTRQGSIVLLHAVSSTNARILNQYIDQIRAKGWQFADPWTNP